MAKRRILKKNICYVAGDLFTEALVCKLFVPGIDQVEAEKVMSRILDMQDDFVRRVNHTVGKDNKALVKTYYNKLQEDLRAEVNAIGEAISELSKKK